MVGLQIFPGIDRLETVHEQTVASYERDSVSVVFLESPMPLASSGRSSGRSSGTGVPFVVVGSIQILPRFSRLVLRHHAAWEY